MNTEHAVVIDTGCPDAVWTVAFHPDGIHFSSGSADGIRRWRTADGRQVSKQTGLNLNAISVSSDLRWIVCGTQRGASVWDAETHEKAFDVEGRDVVAAVDISPDSARFATGTAGASVWDILTGQRLLGPLEHDNDVRGLKFSPNGELIATACEHDSIRIFDSHDGSRIIAIETVTPSFYPITPLAWSNDGQRIFATSNDKKIHCFDASTGSQIVASQALGDADVRSVALAANGRFVATFADRSVSFLDASTLDQIGPVVCDDEEIHPIALSPDSSYLATGRRDGKISVWDLGDILPSSYGPFHASPRVGGQDEHDDERFDSETLELGKSGADDTDDDDSDDLGIKVHSSTPGPLFDYDEPPSPIHSVHSRVDKGPPPVDSTRIMSVSFDSPPVSTPPEACPESRDIAGSSKSAPRYRTWLKTKFKKKGEDSASHEPSQPSKQLDRPPNPRSRSQSPAGAHATGRQISWMAAGQRVRRAVAKPVVQSNPKKDHKARPPDPGRLNKDASRSQKSSSDPKEADPAQRVNDASPPQAGRVRVTHQRESGNATISLTLPLWMLCVRSGVEDGTH